MKKVVTKHFLIGYGWTPTKPFTKKPTALAWLKTNKLPNLFVLCVCLDPFLIIQWWHLIQLLWIQSFSKFQFHAFCGRIDILRYGGCLLLWCITLLLCICSRESFVWNSQHPRNTINAKYGNGKYFFMNWLYLCSLSLFLIFGRLCIRAGLIFIQTRVYCNRSAYAWIILFHFWPW